MAEMNKVFVYGTLRCGFPLHKHLRKGTVRFLGKGKIRGRLFDLGEFPGAFVSRSPGDEIDGELYELADVGAQLEELDSVEEFNPQKPDESLFIRQLTDVKLGGGRKERAWVYFLPRVPANARLIPGGDYAEAKRSRN